MRKILILPIFVVVLYFLVISINDAAADTVSWIGPANGDWDNANNWDQGLVPRSTDDVVIPVGATILKSQGGLDTVKSITNHGTIKIFSGGFLAGIDIVSGPSINGGEITITVGNLQNDGDLINVGSIEVDSGGTFINTSTIENTGTITSQGIIQNTGTIKNSESGTAQGICLGSNPPGDHECGDLDPPKDALGQNSNPNIMHNVKNWLIFWLPPGTNPDDSQTYTFDSPSTDRGATNPSDGTYENLIIRYFQDVCNSKYYQVLDQYPGQWGDISYSPTGSCSFGDFTIDTTPFPSGRGTAANPLQAGDLQTEIEKARKNWGLPYSSETNEFFIFTPVDVHECADFSVIFTFNADGCFPSDYCGLHGWYPIATISQRHVIMAFVGDPGSSSGCKIFESPNSDPFADSAIFTLSEEQFESVIDPTGHFNSNPSDSSPSSADGWAYKGEGDHEIGDECGNFFGPPSSTPFRDQGDFAGDQSDVWLNGHPYVVEYMWDNTIHGCDLGNNEPSNVEGKPPFVSASIQSSNSIKISWDAPTIATSSTSYVIFRSTSPTGPFTTPIGTSSSTSFTDSGLKSSTKFCYEVAVLNTAVGAPVALSTPAACATTDYGPPTGVTATAISSDTIKVSWDAVYGAQTYYVFRATSPNGPFSQILSGFDIALTSTYDGDSLSRGTQYCYEVESVGSAGPSTLSTPPACATTFHIATPNGVTLLPGTNSITLEWFPSSGATSYTVYRAKSLGFEVAGTTSSTSFTDTGRSPGSTYCYEVAASNSLYQSAFSPLACARVFYPPATDVTATVLSSTSIMVSWTPPPWATSSTTYTIPVSTSPSGLYRNSAGMTSSASFTVTDLAPNRTYCFVVAATTNYNNAISKPPACATTLPSTLSSPTGVTAVGQGYDSIIVSWSPPPWATSSTSYNIYLDTSYSGPFLYKVGSTTATSLVIDNLFFHTFYYIEVSGSNNGIVSEYSSPVGTYSGEKVQVTQCKIGKIITCQ